MKTIKYEKGAKLDCGLNPEDVFGGVIHYILFVRKSPLENCCVVVVGINEDHHEPEFHVVVGSHSYTNVMWQGLIQGEVIDTRHFGDNEFEVKGDAFSDLDAAKNYAKRVVSGEIFDSVEFQQVEKHLVDDRVEASQAPVESDADFFSRIGSGLFGITKASPTYTSVKDREKEKEESPSTKTKGSDLFGPRTVVIPPIYDSKGDMLRDRTKIPLTDNYDRVAWARSSGAAGAIGHVKLWGVFAEIAADKKRWIVYRYFGRHGGDYKRQKIGESPTLKGARDIGNAAFNETLKSKKYKEADRE